MRSRREPPGIESEGRESVGVDELGQSGVVPLGNGSLLELFELRWRSRGVNLQVGLEELENTDVQWLEHVGGVGGVAEEMDLVLAAEGDELHGVTGLVPVGEEEDVVVGVRADRVDLQWVNEGCKINDLNCNQGQAGEGSEPAR